MAVVEKDGSCDQSIKAPVMVVCVMILRLQQSRLSRIDFALYRERSHRIVSLTALKPAASALLLK